MNYKHVEHGGLRFYGVAAMRDLYTLVAGDEAYSVRLAPSPAAWIDIYPQSADARKELLELLAEVEQEQAEADDRQE